MLRWQAVRGTAWTGVCLLGPSGPRRLVARPVCARELSRSPLCVSPSLSFDPAPDGVVIGGESRQGNLCAFHVPAHGRCFEMSPSAIRRQRPPRRQVSLVVIGLCHAPCVMHASRRAVSAFFVPDMPRLRALAPREGQPNDTTLAASLLGPTVATGSHRLNKPLSPFEVSCCSGDAPVTQSEPYPRSCNHGPSTLSTG